MLSLTYEFGDHYRTYLQDLKDVTNNVHYENFRYNKLASVTSGGKNKNASGK